jgi:programmed cell death protein 5
MEDDELEMLRQRKMQQMQQMQSQQVQQQAMAEERQKEAEAQRAAIMRQILTPEARDRLATVKIAYPDVAHLVEDQLIRLVQMGQIKSQVDEPTLKQILRRVAPQKREISIERV